VLRDAVQRRGGHGHTNCKAQTLGRELNQETAIGGAGTLDYTAQNSLNLVSSHIFSILNSNSRLRHRPNTPSM
jgi:hypothetical protein